MMVNARPRSSLAALILLGAPAALAQTPADAPRRPVSNLTFPYENGQFGGADKYYTTGWQLCWRSAAPELPRGIAWAAGLPGALLPRDGAVRWGLTFGQNIYTPGDTSLHNPDPRDRPCAGWHYGSLTTASSTERSLGVFELQLGVVGPAALGEQVQNNVHWLLGIDTSAGWDHQLKDELGVDLIVSRRWRLSWPLDRSDPDSLPWGIVPSVAASLGNVQTSAAAAMMLKFGSNLAADLGPQRIRPAIGGSALFRPGGRRGWYVIAGVEGRAVAQDVALDGTPGATAAAWTSTASSATSSSVRR